MTNEPSGEGDDPFSPKKPCARPAFACRLADVLNDSQKEPMRKTWKIAGINFGRMHMGDLLRIVDEQPGAEIIGICDEDRRGWVDPRAT